MVIAELLKRKAELENEMLAITKQIQVAANTNAQKSFQSYMASIAVTGTALTEAFAATDSENYEANIKTALNGLGDAYNQAQLFLSNYRIDVAPEVVATEVVPPVVPQVVMTGTGPSSPLPCLGLLACDDRLQKLIKSARVTHPRIADRITDGLEKVVIDDEKQTVCLGNMTFNGGERIWLTKSVKDVFGETFNLK